MRGLMLAALLLFATPGLAAERILALTPHACEILFAVGAGDDVVGAGEYCDYPDAVRAIPRIANHRQVYVEAALRLQPDMAVGLHDNLPGVGRLQREGVRFVASNPLSVQDMLSDMLRIGRLSGHENEARAAVELLRLRLQAMRQARPALHPRVYYEIWHDPLMAAGGASLISSVLDELGLVNVFADVPLEGPRVSVESVLLARPDIIMLSSQSDIPAREAFWHRWFGDRTPRFVIADADRLHRPGPRLIEGMEALQSALRGEGE